VLEIFYFIGRYFFNDLGFWGFGEISEKFKFSKSKVPSSIF